MFEIKEERLMGDKAGRDEIMKGLTCLAEEYMLFVLQDRVQTWPSC